MAGTLRTLVDADMAALRDEVMGLAATGGRRAWPDGGDDPPRPVSRPARTTPEAAEVIARAPDALGVSRDETGLADARGPRIFGLFRGGTRNPPMLLLGAGEAGPRLHKFPITIFPHTLIPTGVAVFERILTDLLG